MSRYTVTVSEHKTPSMPNEAPTDSEILKCGVETFDLLAFVTALTAKPRGRPAKSAKKETAS